MKISYTKQFIKDAKKYPQYKHKIKTVISNIQNADTPSGIRHIKKLNSEGNDYRLRIGNLRIGFSIVAGTIVLKRFLHRKDIYKYFP